MADNFEPAIILACQPPAMFDDVAPLAVRNVESVTATASGYESRKIQAIDVNRRKKLDELRKVVNIQTI
jgi:hypothetical protein